MRPPSRAGIVALLAASLLACVEKTPTQVLVRIEADEAMRAMAEELSVRALDADGFERYAQMRPVGNGEGEVMFPATVPLLPLGGDPARRFELVAELSGAGDTVLARQRVISGFVEGEVREVWIRFTADCLGMPDCGADRTCVGGTCESACMLPAPRGGEAERVACPEATCEPACGPCERCELGACVAADDGATCDGGRCRAGACCTGCWDGEAGRCETGDSLEACGAEGALCETCCADDLACVAGRCDPAVAASGVSTGFEHACVNGGGRIWCWGANEAGQLGDGTTTDAPAPLSVTGRSDWGLLATGTLHTCAIDWENRLHCWGDNATGQLGTGDTMPVTGIVHVSPGTTWDAVTAGHQHTCAIDRVGGLHCWGQNADGIVGEAEFGRIVPTPTEVGTGTSWDAVDTFRRHACALSGTTLYCWGLNREGALEVGSGADGVAGPMPVTLDYLGDVVGFAAGGFFSCALSQAMEGVPGGGIRCWGINAGGQLGRPEGALASDPIGGIEDFLEVAAGRDHACAMRADRSLWCWGRNADGQVGSGNDGEVVFAPERVGDRADWREIDAGGAFTCGIRERGTLWCWGSNARGQLGIADATTTSARTPVRVCMPPP